MARNRRKTVHYDWHAIPARRRWTPDLDLGSHGAGAVLGVLACLIREHGGGCNFRPNRNSGRTDFRLEWHLRHASHPDLLRVGLLGHVSPATFALDEAYVTTNTLVQRPWRALPEMSERTIQASQRSVATMLGRAVRGLEQPELFHCVTHMTVPPGSAFEAPWAPPGAGVRVLPTVVLSDRARSRVSAVIVSARAPTREQASDLATESTYLLAALATLSTGLVTQLAHLHWPARPARSRVVLDPVSVDAGRLYPRHSACSGAAEFGVLDSKDLESIWLAFAGDVPTPVEVLML